MNDQSSLVGDDLDTIINQLARIIELLEVKAGKVIIPSSSEAYWDGLNTRNL